ncbi:metal-dependent hydrolase [Natronoarchaeum rubrum]|uniref:metal-dependent hydrolase n=1 Tax=Natronoarchaeum rubrum TaxID=755311 RepID=UPI002112FC1A|nr:metal-dependent hydrolase [Natronoarchaeum rubrum]
MMLTTHVLVGLALATPVLAVAPELGVPALAGGAIGGAFPDADMYTAHRRTLHFPVYFAALAVPALGLAAVAPTPATVALALFLLAAAVHCRMDAFGGGLELRPWKGTSDRAVYDHYRGRWRSPRRWIRYDGAPEDFAFGLALGVPLWVVLDGPFDLLVAAALAVSAVYAAVRKRLPDLAPVVAEVAPEPLESYLPDESEER